MRNGEMGKRKEEGDKKEQVEEARDGSRAKGRRQGRGVREEWPYLFHRLPVIDSVSSFGHNAESDQKGVKGVHRPAPHKHTHTFLGLCCLWGLMTGGSMRSRSVLEQGGDKGCDYENQTIAAFSYVMTAFSSSLLELCSKADTLPESHSFQRKLKRNSYCTPTAFVQVKSSHYLHCTFTIYNEHHQKTSL